MVGLLGLFGIDVVQSFYKIMLSIDVIFYRIIGRMFKVFQLLADTRILSSDAISGLTQRLYAIISVVMLFILVYSFIRYIFNPDLALSGTSSAKTLVKNIIIALAVIILAPTGFEFAYGVQSSIIQNNIIGNIIMGNEGGVNSFDHAAGSFTTSVFKSSYFLNRGASDDAQIEYAEATLASIYDNDVSAFGTTIGFVSSGDISYHYVISLIVAGIVMYLLLTFSIDLGLRAVKLAFLEIVAPIPALVSIVPGKADALKKWAKEVFKSYAEVLVRVALMFFIVYLFQVINVAFDRGTLLGFTESEDPFLVGIVRIFVTIGLLLFVRQAPKLICDILGIKYEGGLLSLRKRFDDIREAAAPITTAVSRTAGAVGGAIVARRAYRQGVEAGNTDTRRKNALATFHGLRNGFRGGLRNFGNAYNYEMEVQRSYALNSGKSEREQILGGIQDSLRDNFGFNTRYDDEIRRLKIERDLKNNPLEQERRAIEDQTSKRRESIKNGHKATENANTEASKRYNEFRENLTKKANDHDSSYRMSVSEMIEKREEELTKKIREGQSSGKDVSQLLNEHRQLQLLTGRTVDAAGNVTYGNTDFINKMGGINTFHNNNQISSASTSIMESDDFNANEKNVLYELFESAKKNNERTLMLDRGNWSSSMTTSFDSFKTYVDNNDLVGDVSSVDRSGNSTHGRAIPGFNILSGGDLQVNTSNVDDFFKIKSNLSKVIDLEAQNKNHELNEKADIEFTLSNGTVVRRAGTLDEFERRSDELGDQIKTNNAVVEKYEESHVNDKESTQVRSGLRNVVHRAERRGGNNHH